MKKCFWTIGFTVLFLILMSSSYTYYSYRKVFVELIINKTKNLPTVNLTEKPLTGIWTINTLGRLGNVMAEYASLYSLAKMNGHQAYILSTMHDQLSKIFKITLPVIHPDVVKGIKWRNYGLNYWMSEEHRHITGEYVYFNGIPCSLMFYHHIRAEILREFTFHDLIKEKSYAYLDKVRGDKKNVTFVGIHVRRGDFARLAVSQWKWALADKGYLQKATDYFRTKYQNPLFIVASNGMDWCKENINNSLGDVHFAGDGNEGSPARDFALLAHCNHTIMTQGTFGNWVAYLVGGETVYLTNFTLPGAGFKYEAAFLPEWVGIPADLSPVLNMINPK